MAGDPALIKVRTDVVRDVLVPSLHRAAAERARGEGEAWLEDMGRRARGVELERFAPARAPMPWLAELLEAARARGASPAEATAEVSRSLADEEPDGRPDPPSAPTWRVPGPGGHVRYYVAMEAVAAGGTGSAPEGRRAWLRGFFAACCAEVLAAAMAGPDTPAAPPPQ